jgi:hypothetical protein
LIRFVVVPTMGNMQKIIKKCNHDNLLEKEFFDDFIPFEKNVLVILDNRNNDSEKMIWNFAHKLIFKTYIK